MRKSMVSTIIIVMLCSVVFFNLLAPNYESGTLTTLSGDLTEKELKFKSGGSDESINIELNKEATVISSEISVSGSVQDGEYPKNVEIDVGSDGDNEWQFIGEGYGRLGQQTTFSNDKEYQSVKFKTGGYDKDTCVLILRDWNTEELENHLKKAFNVLQDRIVIRNVEYAERAFHGNRIKIDVLASKISMKSKVFKERLFDILGTSEELKGKYDVRKSV